MQHSEVIIMLESSVNEWKLCLHVPTVSIIMNGKKHWKVIHKGQIPKHVVMRT